MNTPNFAPADDPWTRDRIDALIAENARLREAVAARDSFLAVAAHELRNPMTPILGRVTLLRRAVARGAASNDQVTQGLERIERLVVHFIKRATTLLDVARADADAMPVDLHAVDVAALIAELVESYRPAAQHAGAVLEAQAPATLAVRADRLALEQVLENLITNAIKYGAASPIMVDAFAVPERHVAVIRVRDQGPGIALEKQDRVFDRYERAQEPGTEVAGFGVGLWLVRRLCNAMGGHVGVMSTPGSGATFSVSLPLIDASETP